MECQIHSLNPRLLSRISQCKPMHNICSFLVQPKSTIHKITLFSSYNNNADQQQAISTTTSKVSKSNSNPYNNVKFKTLGSCRLGISRYPDFEYNAEGGTGTGITITRSAAKDATEGEISVDFDLKTLYIPPLTSATTKFLGLPLPPFLRIDIAPELFQGRINPETGRVDLEFKAKFWFSVGTVYRAPPLLVETVLTSEESRGAIRKGKGHKLDEDGRCRLVGIATVQPIDDFFMNSFLGLPTECLADLNAIISFSK